MHFGSNINNICPCLTCLWFFVWLFTLEFVSLLCNCPMKIQCNFKQQKLLCERRRVNTNTDKFLFYICIEQAVNSVKCNKYTNIYTQHYNKAPENCNIRTHSLQCIGCFICDALSTVKMCHKVGDYSLV